METGLTLNELRIIGCLIEKEITTPDQYPLSLNALTAACNQKSNREPVLDLDEITVQQAVDQLKKRHLVREESGFSSRVSKYKHRFCNTEFSELQLSNHQLAVICVLFLRGPQTPGELRVRCARLSEFEDIDTVERTLADLMEHSEGVMVRRLPREPGKRESRYAHCFGTEEEQESYAVSQESSELPNSEANTADGVSAHQRIAKLEEEVEQLRQQMSALQSQFDELMN